MQEEGQPVFCVLPMPRLACPVPQQQEGRIEGDGQACLFLSEPWQLTVTQSQTIAVTDRLLTVATTFWGLLFISLSHCGIFCMGSISIHEPLRRNFC